MQIVARSQEPSATRNDIASNAPPPDDFSSDIPFHVAEAAFGGGFIGRTKARATIASYAMCLAGDRLQLIELADDDDKIAIAQSGFDAYRAGYRIRMFAYLIGMSRKAAALVGAPVKLAAPVEDPMGAASRLRAEELEHYRAKALAEIRRQVQTKPRSTPRIDCKRDLLTQLRDQLASAELLQHRMKVVNSAIRRHADDRPAQMQALALVGLDTSQAAVLLVPDFGGKLGYKDHQIKNNFGEISRLRRRIQAVLAERQLGMTEQLGSRGRVQLVPAEQSVWLYLVEQPDKPERMVLHRGGFRFAASLGAWKADLDEQTMAIARDRAGVQIDP